MMGMNTKSIMDMMANMREGILKHRNKRAKEAGMPMRTSPTTDKVSSRQTVGTQKKRVPSPTGSYASSMMKGM